AGHVAAVSSTDGVWRAGTLVDGGDYSGPAGARLVLRDQHVTAAALETARGGMLRRGLAINRATAAVVTRVAPDHMGEYGVHDLRTLGEAKLIVARVVIPGGRVVLNADDPTLVALARTVNTPITWFSLDPDSATVAAHVAAGGDACVLRDGTLWFVAPGGNASLGLAADMPLTLGGAARYNVANALAASAAALAMGVPADAVRATLARFGQSPSDNPGRLSLLEHNGARIVVDFVHNPDGWHALSDALRHVPAKRRIVVIGQAGDRDDEALDELAAALERAPGHGHPQGDAEVPEGARTRGNHRAPRPCLPRPRLSGRRAALCRRRAGGGAAGGRRVAPGRPPDPRRARRPPRRHARAAGAGSACRVGLHRSRPARPRPLSRRYGFPGFFGAAFAFFSASAFSRASFSAAACASARRRLMS
ncbi:MAG: glutamate ligase domain-containing protein, partial [Gemmatimonadota bacterium]